MNKTYTLTTNENTREVFKDNDGTYVMHNVNDTTDFRKNFDGYIGEKRDNKIFSLLRNTVNRIAAESYTNKKTLLHKLFNFFVYPTPCITPSSILDMGCGSGIFLHYLSPEWTKEGLDISAAGVAYARDIYKLKVTESSIYDFNPSTQFDVIRASHLIEHFDEPKDFLKKCNALLKDNGSLILYTPNITDVSLSLFGPFWYGFFDKTHKRLFDLNSLLDYAREAGFDIVHAETYYMGIFSGSFSWKFNLHSLPISFILSLLYLPFGILFSKFGRGEAIFIHLEKKKHV